MERLRTGWNFRRVLFLFVGLMMTFQSGTKQDWLGVALGGYFAAMGLFQIGCASGNCFGISNQPKNQSMENVEIEEVEYEEVKLNN